MINYLKYDRHKAIFILKNLRLSKEKFEKIGSKICCQCEEEEIVLMGYSLGAWFILKLLERYPELKKNKVIFLLPCFPGSPSPKWTLLEKILTRIPFTEFAELRKRQDQRVLDILSGIVDLKIVLPIAGEDERLIYPEDLFYHFKGRVIRLPLTSHYIFKLENERDFNLIMRSLW